MLGGFALSICMCLLVWFLCWGRSFIVHGWIINCLKIFITCIRRVALPNLLSDYKRKNYKASFICSSCDSFVVTVCYKSDRKEKDTKANGRTGGRTNEQWNKETNTNQKWFKIKHKKQNKRKQNTLKKWSVILLGFSTPIKIWPQVIICYFMSHLKQNAFEKQFWIIQM